MRVAKKLYKAKFALMLDQFLELLQILQLYSAFSDPGDAMLAPSIPAGGHISHGKKETFWSRAGFSSWIRN